MTAPARPEQSSTRSGSLGRAKLSMQHSFYDLADGVPHRDGVGAYPECVLAQIDGTRLKSWEPAACP